MATEQWIIYRDVTDFTRKVYEIIPTPGPNDRIIQTGVFPGAFGYPPLHICWIRDGDMHLLAYTEHELTVDEQAEIIKGAREFIQGY